jgi:hypothetical protein
MHTGRVWPSVLGPVQCKELKLVPLKIVLLLQAPVPTGLELLCLLKHLYSSCDSRTGCHDLRIDPGIRGNQVPRLQRFCQLCNNQAIDDERHIVLECPALHDLRAVRQPV